MMPIKMRNHNQGFSLVELVVVVAIFGILTTLAVPAARNYFVRSRRAEFTTTLRALSILAAAHYGENTKMPWGDNVGYVNDTTVRMNLGLPANGHFRYNIDSSGAGTPFIMPILLGIGNDGSGSDRDELLGVPGLPIWICQDKTTGQRISASRFADNQARLPMVGTITEYGHFRTLHYRTSLIPCRDGGNPFSF